MRPFFSPIFLLTSSPTRVSAKHPLPGVVETFCQILASNDTIKKKMCRLFSNKKMDWPSPFTFWCCFWYWCFHPHWSIYSVCPVCGIFGLSFDICQKRWGQKNKWILQKDQVSTGGVCVTTGNPLWLSIWLSVLLIHIVNCCLLNI